MYAVVVTALWTLQQASLYNPVLSPISWTVPHPAAHGFMMIYGLMGFYIFGFLLTTFPRWLDGEPVPRRWYLAAWGALNLGGHGFWAGLFLSKWLAVAGACLLGLGYLIAMSACLNILARSPARGLTQQIIISLGLLNGAVGIACAAYGFASGEDWAFRAARWVGIYPFLLQVVLTVVYRMVPFFTVMVTPGLELRRSRSGVPLIVVAVMARGLMGFAGAESWAWTADGLLFFLLAREMVVWRFWRSNFPPLLLILYLALAWFLVSFALSTGEGLYLLTVGGSVPPFRNAALHALTVGGFGGLLLGISTRVSLGHSGRGLATGPLIAFLFLAFQAVPLARVLPEVAGFWWPEWSVRGFWSGAGWVLLFGLWLIFIGPVLMRPRGDGRPG